MAPWDKSDQTRVNETIAHIVSLCPAQERQTIKAFLDHWIAANYPNAGMFGALSSALSTSGYHGVGDEATRAARRALIMLRGDMIAATNALHVTPAHVMGLQGGQVTQQLTAILPAFRTYALQEERVRTRLQDALTDLLTQPSIFLANNLVVCQSWGVPPGGVLKHRFIFDYANQVYLLLPPAMPHALNNANRELEIDAVNVPEIYWANVPGRGNVAAAAPPNFTGIVATPVQGASLMVTSAFTGCSFCFKNNGGSLYAAHVSPATPNDPSIGAPPTLANQLIANGDFAAPPGANAGALRVYGRGASNLAAHPNGYAVNAVPGVPLVAASMYVFGMLIGGGWRIYSQENNNGAKTATRLL